VETQARFVRRRQPQATSEEAHHRGLETRRWWSELATYRPTSALFGVFPLVGCSRTGDDRLGCQCPSSRRVPYAPPDVRRPAGLHRRDS
jgi:hypothetical protein